MAAAAALSSTSSSSRRAWLDGASRLGGLDLARGLAVLGMLAAHLVTFQPFSPLYPETWGDLVNGRSSILFGVAAGVSIALVSGGRTPLSGTDLRRARMRLAVRAVLLWVIGVVLLALRLPVAVILPAYGILFLLALPFLRLRARTLFIFAGAFGVVMPAVSWLIGWLPFWPTPGGALAVRLLGWEYPFPVWLAYILVGMAIGRLDLRSVRVLWTLMLSAAVVSYVAYMLEAYSGAEYRQRLVSRAAAYWTSDPHTNGVLEVFGSGGFAVAILALCLLVCRSRVASTVLLPLRATGAMPLTAYIAQLLVWAVLAQLILGRTTGLVAFRELDPFLPIAAGIVVVCTAWALTLGRGPVERLLGMATSRL